MRQLPLNLLRFGQKCHSVAVAARKFLAGSLFLATLVLSPAVASAQLVPNESPGNRIPLILIHGWCGSQQGTWDSFAQHFDLGPLKNQYKLYYFTFHTGAPRLSSVVANAFGDCVDRDLDHTWERVQDDLAIYLKNEIDTRFGSQTAVAFLTHSLGGLIARSYMQELNGYARTLALVTLATPHHGTLIADLGDGGTDLLSGLYWDQYVNKNQTANNWLRCLNGYQAPNEPSTQQPFCGGGNLATRHQVIPKIVAIGTVDDEVVPIDSALFYNTNHDDSNLQVRKRYLGNSHCLGRLKDHQGIHEPGCNVADTSDQNATEKEVFTVINEELLHDLTSNVAVAGLAGPKYSARHFKITVPSGASSLAVTISGGTGDADLYVLQGERPSLTTYRCRPWFDGNDEPCPITNPPSGEWYIMLHGYAAYSGVTLRATYAMATSFSSSGRVTTSSGAGISGVSISFSRLSGTGAIPASVQTDVNGNWSRSGFQSGSTYRASPTRSGYSFNPAYRDFSASVTGLNFTGIQAFNVSGRVTTSSGVGVSGVAMNFGFVSGSGTLPASVQTDVNGNWSQTSFNSGSTFRVTPIKTGYSFSPTYRDFSAANTALNFTGTSLAPTAGSNAATNVTSNSATLNGTVDARGVSTVVFFHWGPTTNYAYSTTTQTISATGSVPISLNVSGLAPNTTYNFRIVASNSNGTTYGVNMTFTSANSSVACALTSVSVGQTVSGTLSTNDCRSPVRSASYYADRYSFSGSAGQQISLALTSTVFDTYLYLIGASGAVIAQDDDGGGGNNSRIPAVSGFFTLPATGTYVIEVTSYAANSIGNYTLNLATNSSVTLFQDNMENGVGGWAPEAPWTPTTLSAHSGVRSWSDSAGGSYGNNVNASLWSPVLNFSGRSSVTLSFWHRYDLESGFDFGNVWVTADNGLNYTRVAFFTGTNTAWTQSTINLSAFAGRPSVKVVFQLFSNAAVTRDGWYIDDVTVTGN